MILAADIRNDGITLGVGNTEREPIYSFRLSAADRSEDEWTHTIRSLLQEGSVSPASLSLSILSSVVPHLTAPFVQVLKRLVPPTEPIMVGPGTKTGLRIRTDNPSEVGSDLVCNAVSAVERVGFPCIIVDFGATLSCTVIDVQKNLIGVAIAPGLEAAVEDLRRRAALLPQVCLEEPRRAIGKNTAESIRAGVLFGWAGLVDRLIDEISAELNKESSPMRPFLVGTGAYPQPPLRTRRDFDLWDPMLALRGLFLIAQRQREALARGYRASEDRSSLS
jgi:type III pantothenate kinase